MEDSRTASLILLVMGILVVAGGIINYAVNTYPKIVPLQDTVKILELTKTDATLELKLNTTAKALATYLSGESRQNTQGLLLLLACNSTEEFDYLLPQIQGRIQAEKDNINFNLRGMTQSVLVAAWVVTSGIGTFDNYEDWSTGEKHAYIAFQFALVLAIIVSFIP